MSAVDEAIVREYFESHGFLLCQRRKYIVQAREKRATEDVDLVVVNPRATTGGSPPDEFELSSPSLGKIARAIVAVKGWHTELFGPSVLKHQPKIFRFASKKAIDEAIQLVGGAVADMPLLKILVVPGLPRGARARQQSIEVLKQNGVDGVISFRLILEELVRGVSTNRNYVKSDLLQTLRLLKHYGLIREPQLELKFGRRASRWSRKSA